MSYDLALRRQIPGSVTRDDARVDPREVTFERALVPLLAGAAAAAASVAVVLHLGRSGKMGRAAERASYRTSWRDLATTREMPTVTMRELVYGPRGER